MYFEVTKVGYNRYRVTLDNPPMSTRKKVLWGATIYTGLVLGLAIYRYQDKK